MAGPDLAGTDLIVDAGRGAGTDQLSSGHSAEEMTLNWHHWVDEPASQRNGEDQKNSGDQKKSR